MKKRIAWIDVAKGICMISIIAGHMEVDSVKRVVFLYHLAVFFILSGYTLKVSAVSKDYLNKKFKTLMVPYFLTCFAVTLMDVLNQIVIYKDTSVTGITGGIGQDLVRSFFASGAYTNFGSVELGTRIGALWFLPALFFAILFTQLILNHVKRMRFQILAALLLCLAGYLTAPFVWMPFSIQSGMFAAPFVLFGYYLRQRDVLNRLTIRKMVIPLVVTGLVYAFGFSEVFFVYDKCDDLIISMIGAAAASLCVIYLAQKIDRSRLLGWIGRNSLFVLCIHLFEMETLGKWYVKLFDLLHLPYNLFLIFVFRLVLILVLTAILTRLAERRKQKLSECCRTWPAEPASRDRGVDILKGFLIISMIVGHFTIDGTLRSVIYSVHMMAFVFLSGYFYRPKAAENLKASFRKLAQAFLIPYGIFAVCYLILNHGEFGTALKSVIAGMSFSDRLFTGCDSVGPVYFILLLFVVRCIYLLLNHFIQKEQYLHLAVIFLSLAGAVLGWKGLWLPWSIDCALYSVIFYHLGYVLKKYGILSKIMGRWYLYFLLAPVWVFMIYSGSMELAIRNYGNYGLVLIGALAGIILLMELSGYVSRHIFPQVSAVLTTVGAGTLYILIIHALFYDRINQFVGHWFTEGYIWNLAASALIQLILGTVLSLVIARVKRGGWKILPDR